MSPFIDSKIDGYVPIREKEIKHLKGEEVVESESDNEEMEEAEKPVQPIKPVKKEQEKNERRKGDADSSSDEEDEPEEDPHNMAAARKAKNAQLKKDLEAEKKEMAKVLMTNRQRKLYQQAE